MGCVSSKSFRRGPDRQAGTWYLPVSQNSFVSEENWDADHVHSVCITSSPSNAHSKERFFNVRSKLKLCKILSREKSFTLMSHSDAGHCFTNNGNLPIIQFEEEKKQISTCSRNMVIKPVAAQLKSESEDDSRKHIRFADCLQMQQMEMPNSAKASSNEDYCKSTLLWADTKSKNSSSHSERESLNAKFLSACKNLDVSALNASRPKSNLHLDAEIINMQELMEGLEDTTATPSSCRSQDWGMPSIPDREISFSSFPDLMSADSANVGSPVWKKYYILGSGISVSPTQGSPFNESPRRAALQSPFTDVDDARSVSSIEPLDANPIGLKILLSPSTSSFHPSPVNRAHCVVSSADENMHGKCGMNAMCDGNLEQFSELFYNRGSPYHGQKPRMGSMFGFAEYENAGYDVRALGIVTPNETRLSSRMPSMDRVYDPGSPLFDPSLMATFEQALKASMTERPSENWLSNETLKLETYSIAAETIHSEQTTEKQSKMRLHGHELKIKVTLSSYEMRCPPRGEGKVVLYFTSLRGIRKTFEDCCDVRLILRGLAIQVDERDVWMHSEFRSELKQVLDGLFKVSPQVPQLFIKGRYIGGAEAVKQLHEDGTLSCLMDGLPMLLIQSVCKGCGDARFVPCFTCNGSRKLVNPVDEVMQCLTCNENGLTMCPMCIM